MRLLIRVTYVYISIKTSASLIIQHPLPNDYLIYFQTERDTVEVIAYLKKEDGQKDQEIDSLRQQVKDIRVTAHNERDSLITNHEQKVTELKDALNEKNEEVGLYICMLSAR